MRVVRVVIREKYYRNIIRRKSVVKAVLLGRICLRSLASALHVASLEPLQQT